MESVSSQSKPNSDCRGFADHEAYHCAYTPCRKDVVSASHAHPAMVREGSDGRFTLMGIRRSRICNPPGLVDSAGLGIATTGKEVFTKVADFVTWIKHTISEDGYMCD